MTHVDNLCWIHKNEWRQSRCMKVNEFGAVNCNKNPWLYLHKKFENSSGNPSALHSRKKIGPSFSLDSKKDMSVVRTLKKVQKKVGTFLILIYVTPRILVPNMKLKWELGSLICFFFQFLTSPKGKDFSFCISHKLWTCFLLEIISEEFNKKCIWEISEILGKK